MNDKTSQTIAARGSALPEDAVDRRIREIEAQQANEERAHTARAMQQRQQQAAAAKNTQDWCTWIDERIKAHHEERIQALEGELFPQDGDRCSLHAAIGEVIADEREDRRREVKAAIDEERRASEARMAAMEQRIVQQIIQHNEQRMAEWRDRYAERDLALNDTIAAERADRLKETAAAIEDERRAAEARLTAVEQRINQHLDQCSERVHALHDAITTDRLDRRTEIEEAAHTFDTTLAATLQTLEQRVLARPGKLPPAKLWRAESVTYQNEVVTYEGNSYQAKQDTATRPGGPDWVCVARAGQDGQDGRTMVVRGTYDPDATRTYRSLDVVVRDGAAFIAKHDNPGACPNDQLEIFDLRWDQRTATLGAAGDQLVRDARHRAGAGRLRRGHR